MSESSEGCSTAVELEMSEDFSLSGSLKHRRQREDSAYMSQRDSISGGPPETPSPEMEDEDQNGYVLPGDSPERGEAVTETILKTAEISDHNTRTLFHGLFCSKNTFLEDAFNRGKE